MKLQPADSITSVRTLESAGEIESQPPVGLERVMLQGDKLPVVAAVVLLIWLGLLASIFATDRKLARIERALDAREPARRDEG